MATTAKMLQLPMTPILSSIKQTFQNAFGQLYFHLQNHSQGYTLQIIDMILLITFNLLDIFEFSNL